LLIATVQNETSERQHQKGELNSKDEKKMDGVNRRAYTAVGLLGPS
jgi:hypothetical protein